MDLPSINLPFVMVYCFVTIGHHQLVPPLVPVGMISPLTIVFLVPKVAFLLYDIMRFVI